MKRKIDRFWIGLIIGVLGPLAGFFIYGQYFCWKFHVHFSYFLHEVFLGFKPYQAPIATLSILFNLLLFFLFLKLDYMYAARGVMGATLLYAPLIIFFFFY